MIIKKYHGKTKEEAWNKAKLELGEGIVEMNAKMVKPKGPFKFLKPNIVELTIAKEEEKIIQMPEPVKKAAGQENFEIKIPTPVSATSDSRNSILEEKIDSLQNLIVKQMEEQASKEALKESLELQEEKEKTEKQSEPAEIDLKRVNFLKLIYNKLIDNEVDEKYANEIIDEVDKNCKEGASMDVMLSEIYQRMILKLGKHFCIEEDGQEPKVIFFVGPTGVGKTTTIAKIASKFRLEQKKKIALLTADTYRIAAAEQLRTYANILQVPFRVVYTTEEINEAINDYKDFDYVLVDTTGHSPNNEAQRESMNDLIDAVSSDIKKEVFLVLSASTKYSDLKRIADKYKDIKDYRLIFTKLDETFLLGNIYNMKLYTGAMLSYVTCGQNVPDDIEYFNPQVTVKQLLGGKR